MPQSFTPSGYPNRPNRREYWRDRDNHYSSASAASNGGVADWGEVDAIAIRECIVALSLRGEALLIGNSYDGGAYYLVACRGRERFRAYATTVEAVEWQLSQWILGNYNDADRSER